MVQFLVECKDLGFVTVSTLSFNLIQPELAADNSCGFIF